MLGCESAAIAAPAHLGIGRRVRGHDLDGDVAVEPRIARPIHLPHTARSDGLEDFVLGETGACGERSHTDLFVDCRTLTP